MASNNFSVIFDACVLYPAPLRDFLMHLASGSGLFKARWTDDIHDEWIRSVLMDRPDLNLKQFSRTRELMNKAVPDSLIEKDQYRDLISSINLPDENDRHVVAAAIASRADLIITFNLSDFPAKDLAKYQIEACHPDAFVSDLLSLDEGTVWHCLERQRKSLKNPALTMNQVLENLFDNGLKKSVVHLRQSMGR